MTAEVLRLPHAGTGTAGAERAAVADAVACAHCGVPVPTGLRDADAAEQFCCAGCGTAYAILHAHGLDRYYAFADRREAPVHATGRSYEEFDHPTFTERYVTTLTGGLARTELYLEAVHCASCVWLVERVPLVLPGVRRAELDVRRARAVVEWDAGTVPLSAIARMLDQLGYPPHPFRGVTRDAMRTREDRAMLVRIGIAGAIAINVMLAALALYSGEGHGMDAEYTRLFRWISFALIIPTFLWPGRVFFTGAWASLRTRALHMDLPIAIALAAGFIRGAINTVTDHGPVYFDGLAILIFALLVGRFLQQRGQRLATDAAELLHAVAPATARLVEGTHERETLRDVPMEAILPGMTLDVRAGESFAADGVISRGRSSVNAAVLTGESRPISVTIGTRVFAGTHNISAPVRVWVEEAGETSRIARLMRQVDESARRRAPVVQMANRMAGWFVAIVLVAAAMTWVIKTQRHVPTALDDAIALLIVTCPCALALATPLVITVAIGRAARRGMLIKGGDALELLSQPGTLVLDKTGTLTEGSTTLVTWVGPAWVRPLVLALETGSSHPLADGFRRAWPDVTPGTVGTVEHIAGGGLVGDVDGHTVRIGSPRFVRAEMSTVDPDIADAIPTVSPALTPVHVAVDGVVVAIAGLGDRVRADALAALTTLRAVGWRTILLSGDSHDVVRVVGASLGFADDAMIGEATPEDKLAVIERLLPTTRVVMVGDGVNDAAAMAAAHVGIGVHGGAEACLSTADIYLTTPGLSPLVDLTVGAQRAMRVIRRNILLSIAYNALGASLAVTGVVTPLIAAILMPVSSLTVVLGSWYGTTFHRTRSAQASP